jgi:hypothetical protein
VLSTVVPVLNSRRGGREVMHAEVFYFECDFGSGIQTRFDQVANHLVLSVDRDGFPGGELLHVDKMADSAEAQPDAVMLESDLF